ncbi:MAG TPA: LysE family transporter [Candidatus Acidoferrum sp.]|jgi:threonine/homoserine/homoserine lactone efflux protein|nr:LysE family transporter [Candidatus Acidoferrum sp.]
MYLAYFLKGAVTGFSLAAPIGPVGILCVRRTLEHDARHGLLIGVSAASSDMVFSIVAAFGLTLVSDFIALEQYWLRVVGGLILLGVGYGTFRSRPSAEKAPGPPRDHTWAVCSTALLVFTNPLTLFGFVAAFAMLGVKGIVVHRVSGLLLVAGVFLGSLAWFVLLIGFVHSFSDKVKRVGLPFVNRVAGSLLVLCGLYALWNGLRGL